MACFEHTGLVKIPFYNEMRELWPSATLSVQDRLRPPCRTVIIARDTSVTRRTRWTVAQVKVRSLGPWNPRARAHRSLFKWGNRYAWSQKRRSNSGVHRGLAWSARKKQAQRVFLLIKWFWYAPFPVCSAIKKLTRSQGTRKAGACLSSVSCWLIKDLAPGIALPSYQLRFAYIQCRNRGGCSG